ncbi:MAG TPA: DUF2530 domain-containing protein [Mycobacteriales bacterium]
MGDQEGEAAGAPAPAPTAVAVDVDGIAVVSIGTVLWAVALALSLVYEDHLRRDGHLWWIATAACGVGLGLLGIVYCVRRRRRLGDPAGRPPG